jgi:gas vesicle protein
MYEQRLDSVTSGGSFLSGFLCGAALGAAFGLMFAPTSGARLRQEILDSAEGFRREAETKYGQASRIVGDIASRGREVFKRGPAVFAERMEPLRGNGGVADDASYRST